MAENPIPVNYSSSLGIENCYERLRGCVEEKVIKIMKIYENSGMNNITAERQALWLTSKPD